jgi:trans-aconitate 2-methyltransferase
VPVDAVFSNATFHWIADHDLLFRRIRAARRPEFAAAFVHWPVPWNFAAPEETQERLEAAGFESVRCWLEEKTVEPDDPRDFVAVVGLATHHERLPEDLRDPFTDAVLNELEQPLILRYVRLNIEARAAG